MLTPQINLQTYVLAVRRPAFFVAVPNKNHRDSICVSIGTLVVEFLFVNDIYID